MNDQTVTFSEIPISCLALNSYNARRFEENMTPQRKARFEELVDSIHKKGILEPLLVRPIDEVRFEIIAGERRYRAALQVVAEDELTDLVYMVPCMVRNVDDDEAFDIMVIENLQREDLTPFETAQSFKAYLERHGNSHDSVVNLSSRTGIPVHAIRRQVRLLNLPPAVTAAWKEGTLSQSHAELFTRIGAEEQIQELLSACLRSKLTVRELAERIGTIAPDLERGFFDKGECLECHYNTSIQSGLFSDIAPAGKCGNSSCFESKQHIFMVDNWLQGKLYKTYGTRGFRFNHRLPQEHREVPLNTETSPRCLECDAFVSVIRLAGTVISCCERTCVGPKVCFGELYLAPPPVTQPESTPEIEEEPAETETEAPKTDTKPSKIETKPAPKEETGPVFNAQRGEKFREEYLKGAIQTSVDMWLPECGFAHRLTLLVMALGSDSIRKYLAVSHGFEDTSSNNLTDKIFLIPKEDIGEIIQKAALTHIVSNTVHVSTRKRVAELIGIDVAREWRMTREYLETLNVSEIVRIGEEDAVDIWRDPAIVNYRQLHHKGKALRSLKKAELINIIIDSGADLAGKVPAEIIGREKA